jgi:putative ABC transport system permease protein
MLRSMIRTAWRNLLKQKGYSLVGLIGLAVGLAYFAMIAVLEDLQLHADAFLDDAERLYGVVQVTDSGNDTPVHAAVTAGPLLAALRSEFPEIEDGTRVMPSGSQIVRFGEKVFSQNRIRFVDANFLSLFSFSLVSGNRATALSQPYSAVLSQRTAETYFGNGDPLGKVLTINNNVSVTVTAVAKDLYENSSIQFDMLATMDAARALFPDLDSWDKAGFATFLRLSRGADRKRLDSQLPAFLRAHYGDTPLAPKRLYLFPFLDFRLKSLSRESPRIESFLLHQETEVIYMQYASAIIVLLIACLNFMILATSRHMRRAKEIALRKTVGADRWNLVRQFLVESVLTALLALPLALLIYALALPAMAGYMGYSKALPLWNHPFLFRYLLALTVLIGLFAGSYPAFFLSGFKPAQVLKGGAAGGKRGARFRRILVVTQFALAIFLIIWTLMFKKQFNHFLAADFGYDRSRVLAVAVKDVPANRREVLKTELARLPEAVCVAAAADLPGAWNASQKVVPEGIDEKRGWLVNAYGVDQGFANLLGIRLLQGRGFSREFNDRESLLVNETLVRQLAWSRPLGRRIDFDGKRGIVAGVVRDFQFRDPSAALGPAFLYCEVEKIRYLLIKLRPGAEIPAVQRRVEKTWKRVVSDFPFVSITLADHFSDIYSWMNKVYVIMTVLNGFILFVASLGLLGLVSFAVERRTKEIGVRKVLGASVAGIFGLISREFIGLVVLANVVGMLLGTWIVRKLFGMMIRYNLAGFDASIYVLTAALTLGATLLAISWEINRAARANPVESLRYE